MTGSLKDVLVVYSVGDLLHSDREDVEDDCAIASLDLQNACLAIGSLNARLIIVLVKAIQAGAMDGNVRRVRDAKAECTSHKCAHLSEVFDSWITRKCHGENQV